MPHNRELLAWVLAHGWPGLAALGALALAAWGWLAGNGFIDGLVHDSELQRLRIQNEAEHAGFKNDLTEVKSGVDRMLDAQRRQGEGLARIEGQLKH